MSDWTIALGLFVLILLPRMIQGRTPQEPDPEPEEIPQWRRPQPQPRAWARRR
jgi:hypothetical protein